MQAMEKSDIQGLDNYQRFESLLILPPGSRHDTKEKIKKLEKYRSYSSN